MSNLITRNGKPNVIRGGIARQFAPGLFYMNGKTHAAGGIDIGKNPRTGVEVEDGEVVQLNKNGMRVFSAMPFLTGESPANLVASGADPDIVFAAQENFKDRFGINDDGTMKAKWGTEKTKTVTRKTNDRKNRERLEKAAHASPEGGFTNVFTYLFNDNPNNNKYYTGSSKYRESYIDNKVNLRGMKNGISRNRNLGIEVQNEDRDLVRNFIYGDDTNFEKYEGNPIIINGKEYPNKQYIGQIFPYDTLTIPARLSNIIEDYAINNKIVGMRDNRNYYDWGDEDLINKANNNFDDVTNHGVVFRKTDNGYDAEFFDNYDFGESYGIIGDSFQNQVKPNAEFPNSGPFVLRQRVPIKFYDEANEMGDNTDFMFFYNTRADKEYDKDAYSKNADILKQAYLNTYKMGGLSRDKDYGSKKKPYPSVKSSDFAGGNRSYPIPTKADAIDALRLAGLHGRNDVKAKVYRKYPELKKPLGGVISINGNVKNGLVYTGRAKARFGDVYPIIRTKNGYITSGGYVPVDNKIDIYNGQQIEEPQYKIEGQGPVRSLVRGIPIKLDDGRGFYTVTDRPAERVVGVQGFDNLMRVPNFIELENARTAINDWNNQDVPDFENYTPRNNRTVVVNRNVQPVADTPVWDDIFNETVIGERPAVSPRTLSRLSDNYKLTIPDRIIRGGEITPLEYRADITNSYIDGNFDGEVSQDKQPETDTTGGGFNLKDPSIIAAGINMLGSLGSYLINRNMLNKSRPKPTSVKLTAQKLKTRYNINPQLDELREQAAANNRLIGNNTASSRTALGRMNLINTALGRSRAELYGTKENRETELINQDILNSQNVGNQQAIYNAQLRADYQNRLDEFNRLRLANNNALFSGLTGGINSIADSLLRQRYYNNTIGAIGARNPNVDARIFRDAGVDWSFMYPYSTRNRS